MMIKQMVFAGRAFMYGVAALGEKGAKHSIELLHAELLQVMEQKNICCLSISTG